MIFILIEWHNWLDYTKFSPPQMLRRNPTNQTDWARFCMRSLKAYLCMLGCVCQAAKACSSLGVCVCVRLCVHGFSFSCLKSQLQSVSHHFLFFFWCCRKVRKNVKYNIVFFCFPHKYHKTILLNFTICSRDRERVTHWFTVCEHSLVRQYNTLSKCWVCHKYLDRQRKKKSNGFQIFKNCIFWPGQAVLDCMEWALQVHFQLVY